MWCVFAGLAVLVIVGMYAATAREFWAPGVAVATLALFGMVVVVVLMVIRPRSTSHTAAVARSVRVFVSAHPKIAVRNAPQALGLSAHNEEYFAARLHKGYVVLRTCGTPPRVCNVWISRHNTALVHSWISAASFGSQSARLQLHGEAYNRRLHIDRLG